MPYGNRYLNNLSRSGFAAYSVFLLGLLITGIAWYLTNSFVDEKAQQRFETRVKEITSAIHSRMIGYEQVLWGGVGFFSASGNVDRKKFHSYVNSLNIENNWPGIQGIGFSVPVTPADKSTHIESIRAEGFPEYTIKPPGERDEYSAIIYLEPFDWRNKRAFGYDMWSNDMRRQAMARARDTGQASTSGIITLVQETKEDVQKGFLTYLPLYQEGVPLDSVEQRRQAFIGWVYSPFRMGNLMKGILGSSETDMKYQIFDGTTLNTETLLFDSSATFHNMQTLQDSATTRTSTINIQGRSWTLKFTLGKNQLNFSEANFPIFVVIFGLIVSILLFYIIASISTLQRRAEKLAENMTVEVCKTNDRLAESVQKLSVSNEELSKFAYIASHDLQEPLRMVASFCNLLKMEYGDKLDSTANEYIDFAVDGATRMKSLVEGLLYYSRVGNEDLKFSDVDCEMLLSNVLADLQTSVKQANASITHDALPTVTGEQTLLSQLFQNIITNGIKFKTDKPPEIHVTAKQQNGEWLFSIADNGIGIPQEFADHVFDIFKRLHRREAYSGNGMGLAVCKKIIDRHHGRIWVEPNGEQGSVFYFTLPV